VNHRYQLFRRMLRHLMGATIFFQLVSARYERGSIILTSNKSYGDWGSIFGDPIIATAILDRLLHHSTTINIRGESYRLKDRRKAGLFPRADQDSRRAAPFLFPDSMQNGPRRIGAPLWRSRKPGRNRCSVAAQGSSIARRKRGETRKAAEGCLRKPLNKMF
jgi:IstB-like ATP binding protein